MTNLERELVRIGVQTVIRDEASKITSDGWNRLHDGETLCVPYLPDTTPTWPWAGDCTTMDVRYVLCRSPIGHELIGESMGETVRGLPNPWEVR